MVIREPSKYTPPSKRELPKGKKHEYTRFVQSWKRGSSQGESIEKTEKKPAVKKAIPKPKVEPEIKYVPSHLWKPSVEKIVLDFTRDDLLKSNFLLGSRFVEYTKAIYQKYDSNGFLEHFTKLANDANKIGNTSLQRASKLIVDRMNHADIKTTANGAIEAVTALITFVKTTSDFKQYLQDDIWRYGQDNDLENILKILSQEMSENEKLYIKEALYNRFLTMEAYEIEDLLVGLSSSKYKDKSHSSMIQDVLKKVVTAQEQEEIRLQEERDEKEQKYEIKAREYIKAALERLYDIPSKKNFEKLELLAEKFNGEFFLSVLKESLSNSKSFDMSKLKSAIKNYNLKNIAEASEGGEIEDREEYFEDTPSSTPIIDLSEASEEHLHIAGISRGRSKGGSVKSTKSEFSYSAIGSEAPASPTAFNETGIFDSAIDTIGNNPDFHGAIESY